MSPFRRALIAALLVCASSPARAGTGRAVELSLPGETPSLKTGAAPSLALPLVPASGLLVPGLTPALAPAPPAPPLMTPSAVAAKPALIPVALTPASATPAKPVDALRATGAALTKTAAASPEAARELKGLFDGGVSQGDPAASVDASPSPRRGPALAPASPRSARPMPDGVKRAFQNSAVLGGGMAALTAGVWSWTQALTSAPSPAAFAVMALPMMIIPLHFALVAGFWASRYYRYPKMSPAGKNAFRSAWSALAAAYPAAALAALAAWLQAFGSQPALLLLFGAPALVALGEVTHHFVYRLVPETARDKGMALTDWRGRLGGNIGRQLRRMKR